MIAVLQRVSKGDVTIYGKICGAIRYGLVILLGVMKDDTEKDVMFLTEKVSGFMVSIEFVCFQVADFPSSLHDL